MAQASEPVNTAQVNNMCVRCGAVIYSRIIHAEEHKNQDKFKMLVIRLLDQLLEMDPNATNPEQGSERES